MEISLTSADPDELSNEGRRQLFITASQIIGQPHFPSSTPHQCCFHKIVAQYLSTQRRSTRETGQRAVLHEWFNSDNGIMTPVMRIAELQKMQTGRKGRTVELISELLNPGQQRFTIYRHGTGLDDAHILMLLHHVHQFHQVVPVITLSASSTIM